MKVYRILLILLLFLTGISYSFAQQMKDVGKYISEGNYQEAMEVLETMELFEPGKYTDFMTKVSSCIFLQKEAKSLFQKEYYTKAIETYRLIQKYFPNDETVEPFIRQCEIKRDEYNRIQEQKRRDEQTRHALIIEEDALWEKADKLNIIIEYVNYLNRYPHGRYRNQAKERLCGLYINQAKRSYYSGDYRNAAIILGVASKYGTLTKEANQMYSFAKVKVAQQQDEDSRYEILNNDAVSVIALEAFLIDFPQSKYCSEIRGKLIYKYCDLGRFDDARELVKKFQKGIEFYKDFTPDVEWWMKYIKKRERNYTKAARKSKNNVQLHRKQTSFNMFDGLGIMLNAGASISYTSRKEMVTKEYQGIITEEEEVIGGAFLGPRLAFSIGDFYNRFNLEINASYSYSGNLGSQFPIALASRWNIIADGEDFHLYIQPEVGYDVMRNGMFYAGRIGIGCPLGSIFFAVSYNRAVFDRIQYQIGYVYNWMWDL